MNFREWSNREKSLEHDGILCGRFSTSILNTQKFYDVYGKVYKNIQDPPSNSYIELANYRKYVPVIMAYTEAMASEVDRMSEIIKRIQSRC